MLGILDVIRGEFGSSQANFLNGLQLAADVNHYEYMIANHFGLGGLYLELAAPGRARVEAERALQLAEELHSQAMIHCSAAVLAGAHFQLGDMTAAQFCLEKALSPDGLMDTIGKRYCWVRQIEIALARGNPGEGLEITERLIHTAPDLKPGQVIAYLWKLKADALVALDQAEKALPLLSEGLQSAQKTGEVFLIWKLRASLSKAYRKVGRKSEADHQQKQAQAQILVLADSITEGALKKQFLQSAREKITSSLQMEKQQEP